MWFIVRFELTVCWGQRHESQIILWQVVPAATTLWQEEDHFGWTFEDTRDKTRVKRQYRIVKPVLRGSHRHNSALTSNVMCSRVKDSAF